MHNLWQFTPKKFVPFLFASTELCFFKTSIVSWQPDLFFGFLASLFLSVTARDAYVASVGVSPLVLTGSTVVRMYSFPTPNVSQFPLYSDQMFGFGNSSHTITSTAASKCFCNNSN